MANNGISDPFANGAPLPKTPEAVVVTGERDLWAFLQEKAKANDAARRVKEMNKQEATFNEAIRKTNALKKLEAERNKQHEADKLKQQEADRMKQTERMKALKEQNEKRDAQCAELENAARKVFDRLESEMKERMKGKPYQGL